MCDHLPYIYRFVVGSIRFTGPLATKSLQTVLRLEFCWQQRRHCGTLMTTAHKRAVTAV